MELVGVAHRLCLCVADVEQYPGLGGGAGGCGSQTIFVCYRC